MSSEYFRSLMIDCCLCPVLFDTSFQSNFAAIYDEKALERSLKEYFGDRQMFDKKDILGKKIVLTATSILNAYSFIFSNYNGSATRNEDCGLSFPININIVLTLKPRHRLPTYPSQ